MSKDTSKSLPTKAKTIPTDGDVISKKPKSKLTWKAISSVVVVVVSYFVSAVIGQLAIWLYTSGIHHWSSAQASNWLNDSTNGQFFYSLIVYASWIGIVWLFLRHIHVGLKDLGWNKFQWKYLIYLLCGFAVYFVGYLILVGAISHYVHSFNATQSQDVGFQNVNHGYQLILAFISLVILPPFVEETVFRGFLFGGLKKAMPVIWAGLFTSILFAIPHLFESTGGGLLWVAGLDTFILSLVLVYLRQKTKSLWPCVGLHLVKNGIAFAVLFFAQNAR